MFEFDSLSGANVSTEGNDLHFAFIIHGSATVNNEYQLSDRIYFFIRDLLEHFEIY